MSAGAAIEAVWRIEAAQLIAALARMTGDIGLAEDLAQDALVAALERWPESGVPENPGAWLMATAKNRAIDLARRGRRLRTAASSSCARRGCGWQWTPPSTRRRWAADSTTTCSA
ncbi:MAG TPA: sigma factor [Solirubrobacterales bacterium]|nr:sigma factor [Solirubrobacterales bacterium]